MNNMFLGMTVATVIFTWEEYKKYALPIILAAPDAAYQAAENAIKNPPKTGLAKGKNKSLFIFGRSLDRTFDEFEKKLRKINDDDLDEGKKQLIKILKKYKGKKSPEKLKKVQAFIVKLQSLKSFEDIKKKFEIAKKSFTKKRSKL